MENREIRELNLEDLNKVSGGTDHSSDLCPTCNVNLVRDSDSSSIFWKCPRCGNHYFVVHTGGEKRRY